MYYTETMSKTEDMRMDMRMNFGQCLSDLRKQKHISQEVLAEELGVSRQAVAKWESGNSLPDILKIAALADYLEVSADYLLGREQANYDKVMQIIKDMSENSNKRFDGDVSPLVYRLTVFMKSIGCTDSQITDGILAMCSNDDKDWKH